MEIHYPSIFPVKTGLRPHILLELTLASIRLPALSISVKTLIEDTLKTKALFVKSSSLACVSVDEATIEKWVGLTRRIIAIEREYHHDDKTLVRHAYDLNAINGVHGFNNNLFILAKEIVAYDAHHLKNQHPEYFIDPDKEIKQSLALLKNKALWKKRYQEFIETMVYEPDTTLNYEKAIATIELFSKNLVEGL